MHPIRVALLFWVGSSAALPIVNSNHTNNTTRIASPVYNIDFPDPTIIQVDGTWYAFATDSNGYNIQAAKALYFDPPDWQPVLQEPLPGSGSWADEGLTWAPDVVHLVKWSFPTPFSQT